MSSDDNNQDPSTKTTAQMDARDVHLHVLELVLPAGWTRVTPKFWTKDRDGLETYEAEVDGFTLQVVLKADQQWMGRLKGPDGTKIETDLYKRQPDVVRALILALEQLKP
ncbi:hypothetical protein FIV42_07095 [Persicimonas caeni]|uniref:Uncharacterized protein n=1 Tax=Persicimonas caeni TaxID=2292766 RepID=A0A4Y6PRU1_PERCE|nr:hypothetical protein [Persicimonas caeni]QDG50505.1 hypothetical protein FIV42_07095 [Persicimonas caeni]QED31726.1 hypothetical protein FRD00_07090 [Persicimonas caeni]